ncbi:MAG: hypothetical protein AAGI45_06765 [Cyanobacteria bacterium P01_H01_bin.26]
MIISRRKIHLVSSIALAVVLPIVFIAGLLLRPTYDTVTPATEQLLSRSTERRTTAQPQVSANPISAFLQQ